jgi:hypothetical protein
MYSQHKGYWSTVDKVPITKVKVDPRLFSYPNQVDSAQVNYMVENFSRNAWTPILVNEDFFLLDGQHRLQVAKRMKLKYIDVIVQHFENYSHYYGKPIKSLPKR